MQSLYSKPIQGMALRSMRLNAKNSCSEGGRGNHDGDGDDEKIEEDQFDTLMQDLKEFDKSLDDLDLALELGLRSEVDIKKKLATLKKALSEAADKSPGDLKSQRRLQARLEEAIQNANIARRSQIAAEEKFRRQNEILEKALTDLRERNKELNETTKQNTSLLLEQMKFTNWNDQVDDDEISQTASRLYQEIETWVKRHFRAHENDLCWIYRAISNRIFRTFLVRLMVGIVSDDAEKLLGIAIEALSKEVQRTCPSNVGHHWFPATSKALLALNSQVLSTECERITQSIEDEFSKLSQTPPEKRTEGLKSLVWKFVEFKAKLETQIDRYEFFEFPTNAVFNEREMTSYTGLSGPGTVVEYTLSHALFKISQNGDRTLVQKARVKNKQTLENWVWPETAENAMLNEMI